MNATTTTLLSAIDAATRHQLEAILAGISSIEGWSERDPIGKIENLLREADAMETRARIALQAARAALSHLAEGAGRDFPEEEIAEIFGCAPAK